MLIALTGITGFLGRHLLPVLLQEGHTVRALLRRPEQAAGLPGEVRPVSGDLSDAAALGRLVEGAEAVVHLAALGVQSRDRDWSQLVQVNAVGSLALVEAAARAGVGALVGAGTYFEYAGQGVLPGAPWQGPPVLQAEDDPTEKRDAYGATKAAGGLLLRARSRDLGLPATYLRIAQLFGPGDDPAKLLPSTLDAALRRQPLDLSGGEQVREWLHVRDAVATVLACLRSPPGAEGRLLNVGTGLGLRLRDVVETAYRLAGADPGLARFGARPYRPGEPHVLVMDVARARPLHAAATSLERGLEELLQAARSRPA